MNTYPIELRRRVLDAVDNKLGTQQKIAHTFSVSAIWIRKLLQRRRETGSIEPLPRTQGRKPAFRGANLQQLNDFVEKNHDTTLEEIKEYFSDSVHCSIVAIHNTLKRLGWRYKKNRYEPVNKTEKI
jgi:transposase